MENYVGGNDPALDISSILAFLGVILALMQGTLVIESAPARISFKKWIMMIVLEVFEMAAIVASEAVSCIEMQKAFKLRLTWLEWLALSVWVIGVCEVLIDGWLTYNMGSYSRLKWIPFSSAGQNTNRLQSIFVVVPLFLTGSLSLVLVGWRQRLWLLAPPVDSTTALNAASKSSALSNVTMAFCVGWAILLQILMFLFALSSEIYHCRRGFPNLFQEIFYSFKPRRFKEREEFRDSNSEFIKQYGMNRDPESSLSVLIEHYDQLKRVEFGESLAIPEEEKMRNLMLVPLHIGNVVVGPDKERVARLHIFQGLFDRDNHSYHILVLFIEHFTILPLQISVVAALVQLHNKLDESTFNSLKEIVDAVTVLSVVELAIGLKTCLWGYGTDIEVHNNDRTIDEPDLSMSTQRIRRVFSCNRSEARTLASRRTADDL